MSCDISSSPVSSVEKVMRLDGDQHPPVIAENVEIPDFNFEEIVVPQMTFEWNTLLLQLQRCRTYNALRSFILTFGELPSIYGTPHNKWGPNEIIDPVGCSHIPNYVSYYLYPWKTRGDGSCIFRSVSYILFKTKGRNIEIRV